MTLVAGAVATLLAVHRPGFQPGLLVLAFAGLILAHVANNLMNDLFDVEVGADTSRYPRALYAPHPVLSGMVPRGTGRRRAARERPRPRHPGRAGRLPGLAGGGLRPGRLRPRFAYTAPRCASRSGAWASPTCSWCGARSWCAAPTTRRSATCRGRSSSPRSPTACCARPCSWASTSTRPPSTSPSGSAPCPSSWASAGPGPPPRSA